MENETVSTTRVPKISIPVVEETCPIRKHDLSNDFQVVMVKEERDDYTEDQPLEEEKCDKSRASVTHKPANIILEMPEDRSRLQSVLETSAIEKSTWKSIEPETKPHTEEQEVIVLSDEEDISHGHNSCDTTFIKSENRRSMIPNTGEVPYTCFVSNKRSSCDHSLMRQVEMGGEEPLYECNICQTRFCIQEDLNGNRKFYPIQQDSAETYKEAALLNYCEASIQQSRKKCYICQKRVRNLAKHIASHTSARPFKCNICDKSFKFKANQILHMHSHVSPLEPDCEVIQIEDDAEEYIQTDFQYHEAPKSSESEESTTETKEILHKSLHIEGDRGSTRMRVYNGQRMYECNFCMKTFSESNILNTHMKKVHNNSCFCCPVCDEAFPQKESLQIHLKSHVRDSINKKKFQQDPTKLGLSSVPEHAFKCSACDESFRFKYDFLNHMLLHDEEEVTFDSNAEGNIAAAQVSNDTWKLSHGGASNMEDMAIEVLPDNPQLIRDFAARNVEVLTARPYPKTGHTVKRKHQAFNDGGSGLRQAQEADKKQRCHICNKLLAKSTHLETHMRIHTGEKPFQCHVCNRRFNQEGNLGTHLKLHYDVRPFNCRICGKSFVQKINLQTHFQRHIRRVGLYLPDIM